ncbi:TRAP dicarboxylate transporter, DctP subunit [Spirochaeta thermophila DSM 6578]|uniref:TRAP dicarboxylate transporter, DctP subunit n=1 Tax=Winmispira thermophila (strain ATCC 700085 / DSM 6578 / Z-1203) TaxID=869211 RepID=G0GAD1_WINT7|nr:TRAP transporter substrate-binding protein [Spirochaeta thermophila]AEJ61750.1 TRAP dicarboxylate transporter, DctP subunit [Spirochaeta thermophila DSM 6578]
MRRQNITLSNIIVVLILAVVLLLGGCAKKEKPQETTAEAPQQVVLRLAETHPPDYPTTKGDYKFAELVKERTNGRIVIEVYPSSQLGEEKAVIEQVQFGSIDLTRVSIAPVGAFVPILNALQLPYLYRDSDHMWKVLKGDIGKELLKSVEDAGFIGFGWFEAGARSFYTKKPVRTPDDLKGMKIRVMENDLMVAMVNALGGVATPMPYGEVYSALQTGVIDGAENNWPSYYTSGHYEVAKYYTLDEHLRVPEIIIGSKISLSQKLTPEEIEILKQAAWHAIEYQREQWAAYEKVAEEKVRAAGNTIIPVEDKSAWQARMKDLYAKQSPEIQEIVRRIQEVQ